MIGNSGSASGCKNHKVIGAVDYAAGASYADRVVLILSGPDYGILGRPQPGHIPPMLMRR